VSPILAISSWGATIAFVIIMPDKVPDTWWVLVAALSTFYFVRRHEEKKAKAA
jgi:hypothetical protein